MTDLEILMLTIGDLEFTRRKLLMEIEALKKALADKEENKE
jgi:hypothetical protein